MASTDEMRNLGGEGASTFEIFGSLVQTSLRALLCHLSATGVAPGLGKQTLQFRTEDEDWVFVKGFDLRDRKSVV